jgi:hypothetical protein
VRNRACARLLLLCNGSGGLGAGSGLTRNASSGTPSLAHCLRALHNLIPKSETRLCKGLCFWDEGKARTLYFREITNDGSKE